MLELEPSLVAHTMAEGVCFGEVCELSGLLGPRSSKILDVGVGSPCKYLLG